AIAPSCRTARARPRIPPSPTSRSPPIAARSRPARSRAPTASPNTTSSCASRSSWAPPPSMAAARRWRGGGSSRVPLLRKPRAPQTTLEDRQVFRTLEQDPVLDVGDAQRGIEPAQMPHGILRFPGSAGQGVAGGDETDGQQETWQVLVG